MALVVGESEAWKSVKASLQEKQLEVSVPADLTPLLYNLRRRYEQGLEPLYTAFDQKLAKNEAGLAAAQAGLAAEVARKSAFLLEKACHIEQVLEHNRSAFWLKRYTVLLRQTRMLKRRKDEVYAARDRITSSLKRDLHLQQQKLDDVRLKRDQVVADQHQRVANQAAFVEKMLQSKELAGAQAELDVLACPQKLPNNYRVYCDHKLRSRRKIRFAGEYLQSAQIDFLVIGPSGVFVLEVKRWSRQFIAQGRFFDPYEQIGRSSYLCYDVLRTYGEETRVHSILVNCGALPPPKNEDYHVQVVTLANLLGCLTSHRSRTLDEPALNQIVATLKQFSR